MRSLTFLIAPLSALSVSMASSAVAQNAPPQNQHSTFPKPVAAAGAQGASVRTEVPASSALQQSPQWVGGNTPASNAAPASTTAPPSSQQQIQAAFPPSNYGPGNYAVAGQVPQGYAGGQGAGAAQNGVAPIPPLAPPTNMERAEQAVSPFSNQEIVRLREQLDSTRKAKAHQPVRTVPRISSTSVDLSPGSALPIARTLPGETTTLVFVDATGAPWPLAAIPRVSDKRYFDIEWLEGTPALVVSALSSYEDGNVTVFLKGLATPIVVKLSSGEPDSKSKSRIVDYRLDLRVPGRGPNAKAPLLGPDKIALYDDVMQGFLDGIPPRDAKQVRALGEAPARTQVWQYGNAFFVRTSHDIQTAFDQSMASADGTRVYRIAPTPYVTLSDMGRAVTLQLDIN